MKCIIFEDMCDCSAATIFNDWAKDKEISRDVIIHTHYTNNVNTCEIDLHIVVFFDQQKHPTWK